MAGGREEHRPGLSSLADQLLRPVENAAAVAAAIMMFLAMLFTTGDALLRYSISHPLNWNFFVSENYLLVGMVCMPMAWGFRTGGYIRITFFLHLLPEQAANLLLRAGLLAGCILCADLAYSAGLNWHEVYAKGLVEMDVVDFPWHWSWIWVPLGLGLFCLRLLVMAFGPASDLHPAHAAEEEAT